MVTIQGRLCNAGSVSDCIDKSEYINNVIAYVMAYYTVVCIFADRRRCLLDCACMVSLTVSLLIVYIYFVLLPCLFF